jgi:hypothetical protein
VKHAAQVILAQYRSSVDCGAGPDAMADADFVGQSGLDEMNSGKLRPDGTPDTSPARRRH